MYIVNQVLQRTLSTSQRTVVAGVLPSVSRVLGSDFFGMIQRKMRDESYPKPVIQGALPPESTIITFLILINDLDVSIDYVRRIVKTCLGDSASAETITQSSSAMIDAFPFGHEAVFVERTIKHIESNFETKTSELIAEAIEVMLKQVMRPRLRPVLVETFRDVENVDEDADSDDLVAKRFERGWYAFTLPIKRILTPGNYDKLLSVTVGHLARTLEKRLWSCHGRVNELGAIRLERDVASIVAMAVKGGRYELRDLFARSVQMTLIMNMEDDEWEDIAKLSGPQLERETGIVWKLDVEERKRARAVVKDVVIH
ncbi:Golgi transport complex subunit 4 [Oleoguttula sp. CCFEE 5521]